MRYVICTSLLGEARSSRPKSFEHREKSIKERKRLKLAEYMMHNKRHLKDALTSLLHAGHPGSDYPSCLETYQIKCISTLVIPSAYFQTSIMVRPETSYHTLVQNGHRVGPCCRAGVPRMDTQPDDLFHGTAWRVILWGNRGSMYHPMHLAELISTPLRRRRFALFQQAHKHLTSARCRDIAFANGWGTPELSKVLQHYPCSD